MIDPALPGADILEKGIADVLRGAATVEACLVSMAAPRLADLGVRLRGTPIADPETTLYRLLDGTHGDGAHSRYNALLRRVLSYFKATSCAK